jgi:peroxiredoxin
VRFGQWEQQIRAAGFAIVAVSPDEIEPDVIKEYHDRFNVRFPLLADPHLAVFREYRCLAGDNVLHGTFLIDTAGSVRWQSIGEQPEMDVQAIIKLAQAIREQHP